MTRSRLTLVGALASTALLVPGLAGPAAAKRKHHHHKAHHHKASCRSVAHAHFVGLGGGDSFTKHGKARDCMLAQQARAGTGVLRQQFGWRSSGAPSLPIDHGGHYRFGRYDSWVVAAARHHMRVLPILSNSQTAHPPTSKAALAAYRKFAAAMVRHYGPRGTLWRGKNRHLRRYAITAYQIWNEPNLPQYWGGVGHVNAKQYVRLLKAGYQGIKSVDRHADVVTGGLPESLIQGAIQATNYIPQMYRAGAKRWFDTMAINPYGPTARNVVRNVRQVRRIMNHRHDHHAGLWVAEVGWGTGGPKSRFNIGRRGQARQLGKLLRALYHARHGLRLHGVVYYGWKDKKPYPPAYKDMWGLHTGLLTLRNKPKPAFRVFARTAPHLH